jgi:hypothetical protein
MVQLAHCQLAYQSMAENRHFFAVILRFQMLHLGSFCGALRVRQDLLPAPFRGVPDRSRWMGLPSARQCALYVALGTRRPLRREGDHAAIAAPMKTFASKVSPISRPARAASTCATCRATLRRAYATSPPTAKSAPLRAASTQRRSVTQYSSAELPTERDGLVRARTLALLSPVP